MNSPDSINVLLRRRFAMFIESNESHNELVVFAFVEAEELVFLNPDLHAALDSVNHPRGILS